MADKSQNILVNFKYNTAELERANALVNRANESQNRLQQGAQQAGKKISDAYRAPQQSILAMQNQLARLKAQIEVSSNPAKVKQLSQQYKQLKVDLDRATKSAFENAKAVKQQAASTKEATQSFGQLFTAVRALIAVGIVKEVVQTSIEMAKLAGNTDGVSRAFNRTFPDAQMLLADLRRSTHGTIGDFELMQRTLLATNLGVSIEGLPRIFEFVATRVQQTGQNLDVLLDKFIRGIGVKSPRLLDDLGISAIRLKEKLDGVALSAISIGDFTKVVSEIAEEELTKMGGYAETSATQVDKLTVSFQKLKEETAKFSEPFTSELVKELTELADSYALAAEAARRGISVEELFKEKQREEIAQMGVRVSLQFALTGEREKDIKIIEDQITALTKNIGAWTAYRDSQNELIKTQREEREALIIGTDGLVMTGRERQKQIKILEEQIELNKRLRDANKEDILIDQEALRLLVAKLAAIKKTIEQTEPQIETLKTLREELKKLKEQIEDTPTSELGIMKSLEKQSEAVQKKIDKIIASLYFLGKQAPNVEITVTTKPESDLRDGIPLASEGLRPDQMTDLLNSDRTDLSGTFEKSKKAADDFKKALDELIKTIPDLVPPVQYTRDQIREMIGDFALFKAELSVALADAEEELKTTGIDIFADQLISLEDAEVASLQNRLNNLRNFYDEQQLLAGDNDRAKQELRLKEERETAALQKKIAQKQKEARRFSVIIDTAAGIARAFATAPNIAVAIVQAAIVAATGASQLAIINRTQARFAKGVIDLKGPGTGTSDSIHARLSRGESVMTAKETKGSMGILKDIRAKKLNDNVLQNLKLTGDGVRNVGMDDSRIVKEIRDLKNSQPNIIEQSGRLYKQYNKGKDYKKKVRIKNLGY